MCDQENILLRRLLWLHHGCHFSALYGDDGEMQCHACRVDFLRDPVDKIRQVLINRALETVKDLKLAGVHS